ncbi:MAG: hypothetical protein HY898_29145 [Deltaproteobacteria bacterium]|nr:hypothetical protein [Deltaproteobacteria bacterium]
MNPARLARVLPALLGFASALCLPACGSSSTGDEPAPKDASVDPGLDPDAHVATDADGSVQETGHPDASDGKVDALGDGPHTDAVDAPQEGSHPKPLVGVYAIKGSDARWGGYTGQAEVRAGGGVAHLQKWTSASFEGDEVGLAWQGKAQGEQLQGGPYPMSFQLDRQAFIKSYKGEIHEGLAPKTVAYAAQCTRTSDVTIDCAFAPDVSTEPTYTETWTWVGDVGAEPLWANQRQLVPMHDAIPDATKSTLFQTYATYHQMPELQPYVNRPEFQEAMHYQTFDPTDFDFYRANPGVLRVIQRVPDAISLVETRMRNRAYRQTLEQKRAYYDTEMPLHFLNGAGMLVSYLPGATPPQQYIPSGDSMLWTGVYVASQAMRYLVTQDPVAFDNMLRGLHAQIMCFDIVGVDGQFARTIREHEEPLNGWVQGTGTFAGFDWMPGCNNDMLQGYYVAFTWAWLVLKDQAGYAAEKQKMVAILDNLVTHFPVAGDKKTNELKARMILYMMTKDIQQKLQYEALYQASKVWLVDQGNGALWEYGTSDWSGNHLIIQGLLVPYLVSQNVNDGHLNELKTGMRKSLERMRHTRLGLYQLIGATLGDFATPPPELEENLWVLREFPAPKVNYDYDWRIHPDFCMSPFPNLPWKNDWTQGGRFASLVSYTLFERVPDAFAWKTSPFDFKGGAVPYEDPGTDFLFAYWFGRTFGVIDPQM